MSKRFSLVASLALALACIAQGQQAAALSIELIDTTPGGASQEALDAFECAAARWESLITDDVTLRFEINFAQMGQGIIGGARSNMVGVGYGGPNGVANALVNDRSTVIDDVVVNNLPRTSSLAFVESHTGNGQVVIDNDGSIDNVALAITNANFRALGGVLAPDTVDAFITFNSDFAFDYDTSDGIDSNLIDFVGVATHEIGHALGFVSGVDIVDFFTGIGPGAGPGAPNLDNHAIFSILDLFRFTNVSEQQSDATGLDLRDWSVNPLDNGQLPYFSIDGGDTFMNYHALGRFNSGNHQASHWIDWELLGQDPVGIMDPNAAPGELLTISGIDLVAFDAIGWDINWAALGADDHCVPEPGTALLLLSGSGLVWLRRRKNKA